VAGVGEADSEIVRELVEEGQAFEAEVIDAVEYAADPDVAEVTTREVPVDDVPPQNLSEHQALGEGEFLRASLFFTKELCVDGNDYCGKVHGYGAHAHGQFKSPPEK